VTAIAAASATTAETTAASAVVLGPSFVDIDGASTELAAVECGDGFFAIFIAVHFDEAKATGASGIAIGHDADTVDLTVAFENLPEFVFTGIETEIPHKDVLHASSPALICRKCELSSRTAGRETFLKILTGAGNSRMRGKYSRVLWNRCQQKGADQHSSTFQ